MTVPEQDEDLTPPASASTSRLARRLAIAVVVLGLLIGGQSFYTYWATDRANTHAARAIHQAQMASVAAEAAALEAQAVSACLKQVLTDRAATSKADADAHVAFAIALEKLLTQPVKATPAQQLTAFKAFLGSLSSYVQTLVADQRYRDQHPLGKC